MGSPDLNDLCFGLGLGLVLTIVSCLYLKGKVTSLQRDAKLAALKSDKYIAKLTNEIAIHKENFELERASNQARANADKIIIETLQARLDQIVDVGLGEDIESNQAP